MIKEETKIEIRNIVGFNENKATLALAEEILQYVKKEYLAKEIISIWPNTGDFHPYGMTAFEYKDCKFLEVIVQNLFKIIVFTGKIRKETNND